MTAKPPITIRSICFLLGCFAAVAFVLSGRVPESQAGPGARLTVSTQPTTELGVSPAGVDFLSARNLRPGRRGGARGAVSVTNYTASATRVGVRVSSQGGDLDRVLRVTVSADGERVFQGALGALRRWTQGEFALAPKHESRVELRAWLPAAAEGHRGRSDDLELEWRTRSAGS